jgi:hypothetical protein
MKTFFSVLCAILVAAGIFYFIKDAYDTEVARVNLEKAIQKADAYLAVHNALNSPSAAPQPSGIEMSVVRDVRVTTPNGEVTIPRGARVRELREKSDPGMSVINYQGHELQVPSDALTAFVISQ